MSEQQRRGSSEDWNERYGKDHNKRRKSRYHTDPEYREMVKARARAYKREKVYNYREYNGKEYRVYGPKDIKDRLGITQGQFIWLTRRPVIPASVFGGVHFKVSEGQLGLLEKAYAKYGKDYDGLAAYLKSMWLKSL